MTKPFELIGLIDFFPDELWGLEPVTLGTVQRILLHNVPLALGGQLRRRFFT
jgi:hypothetical protein